MYVCAYPESQLSISSSFKTTVVQEKTNIPEEKKEENRGSVDLGFFFLGKIEREGERERDREIGEAELLSLINSYVAVYRMGKF